MRGVLAGLLLLLWAAPSLAQAPVVPPVVIVPGSGVFTNAISVSVAGLATTSGTGFTLDNPTLSTGGVPVQMSPNLRWCGHVWNTASDETSCFFFENLPATAATPTALFKLSYSRNGGAATTPVTISNGGIITAGGEIVSGSDITALSTQYYRWTGSKNAIGAPADGNYSFANFARTIGSQFKVDALPTVASGFFSGGVAPAVTAGSTPLAGSVNVGTVTASATGTITFGGTAFPSAPFCVCQNTTTAALLKCAASTTQLVITGLANFVASDVLAWQCISSK